MIAKEIKATFRGANLIVKFPNVGQILDMESLKLALTGNRYGAMSASGVKSMFFALDLVDAISFISIMCPQLKNIVTVNNYLDLSADESNELISFYKDQIFPWYSEVQKQLYSLGNGEATEQQKSTEEGD